MRAVTDNSGFQQNVVVHEAHAVRGLGRVAAIGIVVVLAVTVLDAVLSWSAVGLARQARDERDTALIDRAGALWQPLYWLVIGLLLAVAILVIGWLFQVRRNLAAIPAAAPRFGSVWSVVAWLIPGVNLVLPAFVVDDVVRNSVPADRRLRAVVWAWWVALIGSEAGPIGLAIADSRREPPPASFTGPAGFHAYVDYFERNFFPNLPFLVLHVVAGILLIIVILRVSQAQHALLPELDGR